MSKKPESNQRIDVSTRLHVDRKGVHETVIRLVLLPRGSGNKNKAKRIAQAFRNHRILKPYIRRVAAGLSSVTVYLECSLGAIEAVNEAVREERQSKGVPGQLALFTAS